MSIFYVAMSILALHAMLKIAETLGAIVKIMAMLLNQLGNALEFLAYQENEGQCNLED